VKLLPTEWHHVVGEWAKGEPCITGIWFYGSRVKGTAAPDSDLDIAFTTCASGNESAYTVAFFNQDRWRTELQALLPVRVHLQHAEPDDVVVWPAVQDHGIKILS
jgi:predicted nucleotidyltransferase